MSKPRRGLWAPPEVRPPDAKVVPLGRWDERGMTWVIVYGDLPFNIPAGAFDHPLEPGRWTRERGGLPVPLQ